jgi:hypothetical protein
MVFPTVSCLVPNRFSLAFSALLDYHAAIDKRLVQPRIVENNEQR